jgi:molybdate transport system ATP-binding protein
MSGDLPFLNRLGEKRMRTGSGQYIEIILKDLDVHLGGVPVLRDIDWHLRRGEHWAVLGANGAGKSTLLKLIHGMLWPRQFKGERIYLLDGTTRITPVEIRRKVSLVSSEIQDLYWKRSWNLPVRTVVQTGYFDTPFLYESLSDDQKARCVTLCERMGIDHLISRGMLELSTGEAKRVLLARALAKKPRLLLLDECCLGLDPAGRKDFLDMIDKLAAHDHFQIVATSHRKEELPRCITHIATIEAGTIAAIRQQSPPEQLSYDSGPERAHLSAQARTSRSLQGPEPGVEGELIRISNAFVRMNGTDILRDISWSMTSTQDWAVLGPNGAGKTTFLKLIHGAVHPLPGGRVDRFFIPEAHNLKDIRRHMGYVSTSQQTTYPEDVSGREVILSGLYNSLGMHEKPSPAEIGQCELMAESLGVSDLLDRTAASLSYGQMRKLLIARAMIHSPVLLLLDEPFAGIEVAWREEMRRLLMTCRKQGARLILVTHHLDRLEELVSHRLVLEKGKITESAQYAGRRSQYAGHSTQGAVRRKSSKT